MSIETNGKTAYTIACICAFIIGISFISWGLYDFIQDEIVRKEYSQGIRSAINENSHI